MAWGRLPDTSPEMKPSEWSGPGPHIHCHMARRQQAAWHCQQLEPRFPAEATAVPHLLSASASPTQAQPHFLLLPKNFQNIGTVIQPPHLKNMGNNVQLTLFHTRVGQTTRVCGPAVASVIPGLSPLSSDRRRNWGPGRRGRRLKALPLGSPARTGLC